MSKLTPDEIRAGVAGPVMDEWIAVRFFDYVYVNGTEEEGKTPYTLCYPRKKAEEWVSKFKSSAISDIPTTLPPYLLGITRWSSEPAACAELQRRLWAGGRYYDLVVERDFVVATLWDEANIDAVHHREPIGGDPIAATCLAWCKVALIAALNKGGQ